MSTSTTAPSTVSGNWVEQKAKLKAKFPVLTDADLRYEEGKKAELLDRLQLKLGKTKEEWKKVLAEL